MILDTNPPLALVRELFIEYSETPGVDLCLETFNQEMLTLPAPYDWFVLGMQGDIPAGCSAMRPLDQNYLELKRLYVRPAFRGAGLARGMMRAALAEGKRRGCAGIRLDTLPTMARAIGLYRHLGFHEISHYGVPREKGLLYFEFTY